MEEQRLVYLLKKLRSNSADREELIELFLGVSCKASYNGLLEDALYHMEDSTYKKMIVNMKLTSELIFRRN